MKYLSMYPSPKTLHLAAMANSIQPNGRPSHFRPRRLCNFSTNNDNEPICGRPLGLKFDLKTYELYIADAKFGILKKGPNGGIARILVTFVENVPFCFLNGLDIDRRTGMVYFTDINTVY